MKNTLNRNIQRVVVLILLISIVPVTGAFASFNISPEGVVTSLDLFGTAFERVTGE